MITWRITLLPYYVAPRSLVRFVYYKYMTVSMVLSFHMVSLLNIVRIIRASIVSSDTVDRLADSFQPTIIAPLESVLPLANC